MTRTAASIALALCLVALVNAAPYVPVVPVVSVVHHPAAVVRSSTVVQSHPSPPVAVHPVAVHRPAVSVHPVAVHPAVPVVHTVVHY